jgi:uncharacterized protein YheU (UPF0270 family)
MRIGPHGAIAVSKHVDVEIVPDDEYSREKRPEFMEEGVEVPCDRLAPETLDNLIAEFVTREWEEIGDASASLEEKIGQVRRQLQEKRARVVFDLRTETCNIVTCDRR